MLSKCSGPACVVRFLHLGDGMLYRLISVSDPGPLEYFWLCDHCSATMTLRLTEDESVIVVPLPQAIQSFPVGIDEFSSCREKKVLLRSVTFSLTESAGDGTGTGMKIGRRAA